MKEFITKKKKLITLEEEVQEKFVFDLTDERKLFDGPRRVSIVFHGWSALFTCKANPTRRREMAISHKQLQRFQKFRFILNPEITNIPNVDAMPQNTVEPAKAAQVHKV